MLHRLKLRILYSDLLRHDPATRREKLRVIFISGIAVYLPFLILAYLISFETRVISLGIIGFLCAVTSIPVAFYSYAKGFRVPFGCLWKERRPELLWLGLKIGFLYAFLLYWMILGMVEFLFGYRMVRAAMISFIAAAVARDGFEIGLLRRTDGKDQTICIFPDGRSLKPLFTSAPLGSFFVMILSLLVSSSVGWVLGPHLHSPMMQTLLTGVVGGGVATLAYFQVTPRPFPARAIARFFLWPGFIMTVTYFLILAYLLRIMLDLALPPSYDLAFLMALSCTWLAVEARFLGQLQGCMEG